MSFQSYIDMAELEAAGPPRAATPSESHTVRSLLRNWWGVEV
jgi:hypothetical protein